MHFKIHNFTAIAMRLLYFTYSILFLCVYNLLTSQVSTVHGKQSISALQQPARISCRGTNGEYYACTAGRDSIIFYKGAAAGKSIAPLKRLSPYPRPFMDVACDTGRGIYRGRIYVCWSDEKNGADNQDVFLVYSEDGGDHWTEPILVTYRPNHKSQLDPALAIDELGRVYLSYIDAQNFLQGGNDFYLARSANGGLLFAYYQLEFLPPRTRVCNLGFVKENKGLEARWGLPLKNKSLSEYRVAVTDSMLNELLPASGPGPLSHQKTVAFADKIEVSFHLSEAQKVDAAITRPLEPGFEKTVLRGKKFKKGDHSLLIDTKKLELEKGSYILTLYCKGKNSYAWILAE